MSAALLAALCTVAPLPVVAAETVEIFAAGSLRGVVSDLAKEAGAALHVEVKPSFGGSGSLRERIEKGEKPDLLMSADLGSPRKLEAQGRTVVPAVAFARNRMCIVSRRTAGVSATNLIDRLLAKDVRVKTSTPVADPSGDYAWAIFDRIEALRPGAGTILKDKAQVSMTLTATPSPQAQSAAAALFASKQVDMSITYCSASAGLEAELPELTSLVVPPSLDPHPVYGLAVLSTKPQAMRLALFLLSEKGQAIVARNGLVAVLESQGLAAK
jgi:ABC-type molybdate transport system substrate-binding protein